ncbi:MAG: hypothetical protein LPK25_07645, partial [Cyclobacteriaceae bacterium]|nr:hypothetical protein [Cyclobacteriaceae bacterium]MDX5466538.1 hypothetical protein [Cyclobacteriaceae bacterium]
TIVQIIVEILLVVMNFPIDTINQIIANARSAFEDIKRDPIGFLKNLLRAVKQGFIQFFDNIVTHLLGGLRDWLFGELASAGINPPADLSFQSILGFVLEVLGLTMDNVWERLALKIGQERVDQIRNAIDTLTGIWTFIKDVWERGPVAIWEYVQEQLSNLWNLVLEQVQNWIMTRIIQQVTTRLLSMLDPTGIMAVVNSFIAFYRGVQSFIEKLREMLEIVNSFVAGVANIARGTIAEAANFLESALARAVPVAIGFLANQVGLRGLGARIAEMIGGLRDRVNAAIDWLIDRALAVGGAILNAGRNAVNSVLGWLGLRKDFTTYNGEHHEIYFEGSSSNSRLMIASNNPKTYTEYINNVEISDSDPQKSQKTAAKTEALRISREIDRYLADPAVRRDSTPDATIQAAIQPLLNQLSTQTAIIGFSSGESLPLSEIEYGGLTGEGGGTYAEAKVLTKNHVRGSTPQDNPPIWQKANRRKRTSVFIRGHLLNHHIGGPGYAYNLTPITGNGANQGSNYANRVHLDKVERFVKPEVQAGKIMYYKVTANYGLHPKRTYQNELETRIGTSNEQPDDQRKLEIMEYEQSNLATSLTAVWKEIDANGNTIGQVKTETIDNNLPEERNFEVK